MNTTEYHHSEEGCERCGTSDVEVTVTTVSRLSAPDCGENINLCCFCYETHLGNILQYSAQYPGLETLARGLIEALHIIKRGQK